MLEDIRDHSAVPSPQETQWMAARPMRAVVRVIVLALIAVASAHVLVPSRQADLAPLVAQATPEARP